tara:strand:- start:2864 stop:3481 length:618 start_codon:yes stop_codon:yes gene_type:complete
MANVGATLKNKGNLLRVKRKVQKPTAKTRVLARKKAERIFERAKKDLINSFKNHPVTQEIQAGPNSSNSSGTLGGYGNLFSYIGFAAGANPIATVLAALEDGVEMEKKAVEKKVGKFFEFAFNLKIPTMNVLSAITPMPWESGRSWLYGIEKGISGFSSYMYGRSNGRSGAAIQTRNKIRSGGFRNTPYMSKILKDFKTELKKRR